MNYGLISVCALVAVLIIVFVYYEKKKISVKEISLIAALSGLAGVLRVPFAAVPNMQPTTFIVVISGYVFGPVFGFMVGAVSAMVSNCFLGQGPWSPWQMLAWGLAGLSAGVMGKLIKEPSRLLLGIFTFVWGFLFDYIMNLWHWLFFVYPLNLKSFIATYAASFYFDLSHATGNFIFAFIFGIDFINIISRFKQKIHYTEIPVKKLEWEE